MNKAIDAVNEIKEKAEGEVDKLEKALELLKSVGDVLPIEDNSEVPDTKIEAEPESFQEEAEAEPESFQEEAEAEPESFQEEAEASAPGPFDADLEPEANAPGPFEEVAENAAGPIEEEEVAVPKPLEANQQEEKGFIENTLSGIKDAFTPPNQKGGKLKNRKSRKGLRTKRFRGGYRRKTRRGRRNSRRLRK